MPTFCSIQYLLLLRIYVIKTNLCLIKKRQEMSSYIIYVYRCGHADVAKALVLELQADVSVKDNAGSTPLHVAAKNGRDNVVSFLLTQPGIDPVSNQLVTSLHIVYSYIYNRNYCICVYVYVFIIDM